MADTTVYAKAFIIVDREEDGAGYLRNGPNPHTTQLTLSEALARYGKDRVVDELRKIVTRIENGGRE